MGGRLPRTTLATLCRRRLFCTHQMNKFARNVFNVILIATAAIQAAAQSECPGGPAPSPQVEAGPDYTFVRFRLDELGIRQHCDQVQAVTTAASSSPNDAGPLVVVFVHGWKHDGSLNDAYVTSFRDFLAKLSAARRSQSTAWKRRVVGVYVSWPANDGAWAGPLQNTKFWETRDRADRVARGREVSKLLTHLKKRFGYEKSQQGKEDGVLVTIGHSFGARIVFESVQQVIADNVVEQGSAKPGEACTGNVVCHPVSGFGELVVLLNPAFEAAQFNTFHRFSGGNWQKSVPPSSDILESWPQMQPPLLLALGAINDEATTWPWQIGHAGGPTLLSTTLTNHDPFVTHDLVFDAKVANDKPADGLGILDRTRTLGPLRGVTLVPRGNANNSPFVVARVDPQVIDGHSGIWTATLRDFLVDYLDQLQLVKRMKVQ